MKRFERSNGLDTALYKNYLYLLLILRMPHHPIYGNSALQCIRIGSLQENVRHGDKVGPTTLANSDSCLKPFKCLIVGHARVGCLII